MIIAGTMLATAAGVAAAEPTLTGPQAPGSNSTAHVVVTYDDNGYPQYDYVYTDPAPQPAADPAGANRLGAGGTEQTWVRVVHPDGSWTVCPNTASYCR
ncbi:hypothetical protein VMT65_06565 [Nocardia sp. CDC153]|uniref:hypothetical protein n=1 Tax=Nocardia sp. CDC153 TaxID=3112167 RepID=UPI002DB84086|nr:hypothetical protein [Nocardia sp. CDC153]MEC3952688.1 hypothetical protein [Nocardia sp. CDC153]